MIFFDVDGTILSHRNNHISDSTKRAIHAAQENGHLAFLNTGRTLAEIEKEITDIGFDGYVCGCGTYISLKDSILLHQVLPDGLVHNIIEDLHSHRLEAVFEGTKAIYYDSRVKNPFFIQVRDMQIQQHGLDIRTFEDPDIECDKFCLIPSEYGDLQSFREKYEARFEFIDRGHNFYEIVPAGFSKATGIQFLEKHLGIAHENTYALGDSTNDLSMLTYVAHSIAMGNSQHEVLKMASFVTKDVDQNGVEAALRHFGII